MRSVAGKEDAAVSKRRHALAGKGVDAGPGEFERGNNAARGGGLRFEHGLYTRRDALGALLDLGVGVPAELEVDAPNIVRLPVQQHALARMKRRIEPEPALGRERGAHVHVGDQEAVVKNLTLALQPEQRAHTRARAVASDHILGVDRVFALRGLDVQAHAVAAGLHADDALTPAQVEFAQALRALDERGFGVVLLQVDEGWALVPRLGLQIEAVEQIGAEKDLADLPAHAALDAGVAYPQAIPDLQRALRKADGARAM